MNVKNLRVFKEKIVPLAIAGTLALSLSACGGQVEMSSVDFHSLMSIEEVQNATLMDEMIDAGYLRYGDGTLLEAADQLERYMQIEEKIGGYDYTGVDSLQPLSDEVYASTLNMSDAEIDALMEAASYKGDDVVALENKLIALKKLDYLNRYCDNWIDENGMHISEELMFASVKCSVAEELGLGVDDVTQVTIPPRGTFSGEPDDYSIKVGDTHYRVPYREGEIWNTINYIYEVQDADKDLMDQENEFETYRKAINFAKTTIAAGSNVKNNKIVAQYDADYIEGNFVK